MLNKKYNQRTYFTLTIRDIRGAEVTTNKYLLTYYSLPEVYMCIRKEKKRGKEKNNHQQPK